MPKDPTKPFVRAPAQGPPRQHAYCCGCGKVLPSESIYGVVQLIDGDTRVLRPGYTARDASGSFDPLLPICATCAATLGEPWLWRVAPRPPRRIRIRRNQPWQVSPRAITCDRSGPYGNPYEVGVHGTRAECVALFIKKKGRDRAFRDRVRRELAGKDLACWCDPEDGEPCHVDVLLRWANETP